MDFKKYFVLLGGIYLLLILVVDVYFLNSLGFGQSDTFVALAFPIVFGWILGGVIPGKYWGTYFTLSWIILFLAVLATRVGKSAASDHVATAFVILFATGCMFATQSVRMLFRLEKHE